MVDPRRQFYKITHGDIPPEWLTITEQALHVELVPDWLKSQILRPGFFYPLSDEEVWTSIESYKKVKSPNYDMHQLLGYLKFMESRKRRGLAFNPLARMNDTV